MVFSFHMFVQQQKGARLRFLVAAVFSCFLLVGEWCLFHQEFGDLNGVECSTLQELVASDEHAEGLAGGIAEICTDTATEDIALATGILRHGHVVLLDVIDDLHTWGSRKN